MLDLLNPNPHILALILTLLTLSSPLVSWAFLLEAGKEREALRYRMLAHQESLRKKAARELASTLKTIAREHGLDAQPPPSEPDPG